MKAVIILSTFCFITLSSLTGCALLTGGNMEMTKTETRAENGKVTRKKSKTSMKNGKIESEESKTTFGF